MNAVLYPLVEGAVAGVLRAAAEPPVFSPPMPPMPPTTPPLAMVAAVNQHQPDALVYLVRFFKATVFLRVIEFAYVVGRL